MAGIIFPSAFPHCQVFDTDMDREMSSHCHVLSSNLQLSPKLMRQHIYFFKSKTKLRYETLLDRSFFNTLHIWIDLQFYIILTWSKNLCANATPRARRKLWQMLKKKQTICDSIMLLKEKLTSESPFPPVPLLPRSAILALAGLTSYLDYHH